MRRHLPGTALWQQHPAPPHPAVKPENLLLVPHPPARASPEGGEAPPPRARVSRLTAAGAARHRVQIMKVSAALAAGGDGAAAGAHRVLRGYMLRLCDFG